MNASEHVAPDLKAHDTMQKTGNTHKIQSSRMQGGGLCRGGLGVNRGISFALTFDGGGIDTLRGGAVTA